MNMSFQENEIYSSKNYQERYKQICVMKKINGLNFDKGHNEVKEGQPNQSK